MKLTKIDEFVLKFELTYVIIESINYNLYTGGIIMRVNYRRLWHQCVEKDISKHQLIELAEVSPSTLTRLNKNEIVSLSVLLKFCKVLHCDVGDVVEATPISED